MKTFILEKNAKPLELLDEEKEELLYDHNLLSLLENSYEVLAVSEHSFYYIIKSVNPKRYLARSQLYYILSSKEGARSELLAKLIPALRNAPQEQKPFIASALLSDSLPSSLFKLALEGKYQPDEDGLIKAIIEAGKSLVVRLDNCEIAKDEKERRTIEERLLTFNEVLEFLRAKAEYGTAEDGEICMKIGDTKFTILPLVSQI